MEEKKPQNLIGIHLAQVFAGDATNIRHCEHPPGHQSVGDRGEPLERMAVALAFFVKDVC